MAYLVLLALLIMMFPAIGSSNDAIAVIDAEYQAILKAVPTLKSDTKNIQEYSAEGGIARTFRNAQGDICLLQIELYGHSGKLVEEYFYQKGSLILVHRKHVSYAEKPNEGYDRTKRTVLKDRYYFQDEKLIRWLRNDKEERDTSTALAERYKKEMLNFSKEVLAKFTNKSNTSFNRTSAPLARALGQLILR